MIPILYDANENEYVTNGIGFLSDAISSKVRSVLNGAFELTLKYPVNGLHAKELRRRRQILEKADPVSDPQPFRIYRIVRSSKTEITVYARHKAYDLKGVTVGPFEASCAAEACMGIGYNSRTENPFAIITDKDTVAPFSVKVPTSAWSLLGGTEGSLLDVYGGEYEFHRSSVRLLSRRGADRGVQIRYGKNLTTAEQDENCADVYTGVDPYWQDSAGTVVYLDAPVPAPGEFDHVKIMPLDLSDKFPEAPTREQLREAAEAYVMSNKVGQPDISLTLEYVALESTEEYKGKAILERVLLGDTVSVWFENMGIDGSARAVEMLYDGIAERVDSVTLGSVKASMAQTIVSQGRELAKTPTASGMQLALAQMTGLILGARGGAARFLDEDGDGMPDTIYVADHPDPSQAVKVWRWNYEGWGASSNGYNGPFDMCATLDGGILAPAFKAGTLQSEDGKIQINLNAGESGPIFNTGISTNGLRVRADAAGVSTLLQVLAQKHSARDDYYLDLICNSTTGARLVRLTETFTSGYEDPSGVAMEWFNQEASRSAAVFTGKDSAGFWLMENGTASGRFVTEADGKSVVSVNRINPGKRVLYSGSISVGSNASVPGSGDYDLFAVYLGSASGYFQSTVLAYKTGNVIRGIGGWSGTETEYKELLFLTATLEEETWTLVDAKLHSVTPSGSLGAAVPMLITAITGII